MKGGNCGCPPNFGFLERGGVSRGSVLASGMPYTPLLLRRMAYSRTLIAIVRCNDMFGLGIGKCPAVSDSCASIQS